MKLKTMSRKYQALPVAKYTKHLPMCPDCGWYGNNYNDTHATFHEAIEIVEDKDGYEYYHCTSCGCDFRKGS